MVVILRMMKGLAMNILKKLVMVRMTEGLAMTKLKTKSWKMKSWLKRWGLLSQNLMALKLP